MSELISRHLARHEVACKCGCGYGYDDDDFNQRTAEVFEKIRTAISVKIGIETPLFISSGCRCREHNKAVGGSEFSRHINGDALDIVAPAGISYDEFYDICDSVIGETGGVGYSMGRKFVHIDTRGQKARWTH